MDSSLFLPKYADIIDAHKRIAAFVKRTPVFSSENINRIVGAELFFKCENLQKVGAFKFRGATNAVLQLTNEERANGVATHSSGNHAAALALAAKMAGCKAYVVMPENAPKVKKEAVKSYGAEITFCASTLQAREQALNEVVKNTGATFIHPYNHPQIIAGQGTAALELLEEINELQIVMAPVGGGGLLSGTALATKGINTNMQVIGAEPDLANDAYQSFTKKELMPALPPQSIADGLLTSLGSLTYKIILSNVDTIVTTSEKAIVNAMRLIWERMKIIVEPSSAVPLAAIIENPGIFKGKKVGIIISGGNVELSNLPF